jgi:DDE superfamily endonuclease/Transposase
MTEEELQYLIEWICASKENRRCRWDLIPQKANLIHLSYYAIRYALRKAGFFRRTARRKPPISEQNRQKRLQFALEHLNWTLEQWTQILWSDETWVTAGRHTRTWVTRRKGEEWDPTCIVEREQRKNGWMFWGCYNGDQKGPSIFWEKKWGSINSESYCERIRMNAQKENPQKLFFMQDNAKAHYAAVTRQELQERQIQVIEWPPFSPDLNPIETVWNKMKDYIQEHFGEKLGYPALRLAVKEAWEAIEPSFLAELLAQMREGARQSLMLVECTQNTEIATTASFSLFIDV